MSHSLQIEICKTDRSTIVDLTGWLDHTTVLGLSKAVIKCSSHAAPEVVFDLGKVTWLDSTAIGRFMIYRQQLEKAGKKLVLSNCKGMLLDALRLANVHKILELR